MPSPASEHLKQEAQLLQRPPVFPRCSTCRELLFHAAECYAGVRRIFHVDRFCRHFFNYLRLIFVAIVFQFAELGNTCSRQAICTDLERVVLIRSTILRDVVISCMRFFVLSKR